MPIEKNKKDYIGKHVKGEHGNGTIVDVVENGYTVLFDNIHNSFYVDANNLDLIEPTGEEPKSLDVSPLEKTVDFTPVKFNLKMGDKNNRYNLELQNAQGLPVGTAIYNTGSLKPLATLITPTFAKQIKEGDYDLKDWSEIAGPLRQAHDKWKIDKDEKDRLDRLRTERVKDNNQVNKPEAISQNAVLERLKELHLARKQGTGTGHPSIAMTKIALDKPVKLSVGGQDREITHLYTQDGGVGSETRLYLGNVEGAYQRVHVTITDQVMSHTMVQTGETVTIPQLSKGGTRIGFNTKEEKGKGFAGRGLDPRPKQQCHVDDKNGGKAWIDGQATSELGENELEGAVILANRFHVALDAVLVDISVVGVRTVEGITPDFKILDDQWKFVDGGGTTPLAEFNFQNKKS